MFLNLHQMFVATYQVIAFGLVLLGVDPYWAASWHEILLALLGIALQDKA